MEKPPSNKQVNMVFHLKMEVLFLLCHNFFFCQLQLTAYIVYNLKVVKNIYLVQCLTLFYLKIFSETVMNCNQRVGKKLM